MSSLLEALPVETIAQICELLTTSDVARLSRASKSTYLLAQSPLYRRVKISSFESLARLVRSLISPSSLAHNARRQILAMTISFDRLRQKQVPTPVLVSMFVKILSRWVITPIEREALGSRLSSLSHFPSIEISLCFTNALCHFGQVMNFAKAVFPRVTKITLYLGRHGVDISDPGFRSSAQQDCTPNASFWRPYLNGDSFPDLRSIKLHHHWARNPGNSVNILAQASTEYELLGNRYPQWSNRHNKEAEQLGPCFGLEKLQEIFLESVPELSPSLLGQILNNQTSKAHNLKKLDIRFCTLNADTLNFLLQQRIDSLTHFTLFVPASSTADLNGINDDPQAPHLCSQVVSFCKNLVYLKYLTSHICRDLFLNEQEKGILKETGLSARLMDNSREVDRHAIRQVLEAHRGKQARLRREQRLSESLAKARVNNPRIYASALELELDQEEEKRKRLIAGAKTPWKRSIIGLRGICSRDGRAAQWDELEELANMEETGVEWVLTSCWLHKASRHSNGGLEEVVEPYTQELHDHFVD